ncbi:hypothetical protein AAG570_008143 [Ranatra chinensis]|uniref:Integrase catalytic domain-containing protein n=1 Tax=Ranatra chinensis TaxID=642074 RepID=A0ABD0YHS0_9HEMI
MSSKRRNMFYENRKQETTEIGLNAFAASDPLTCLSACGLLSTSIPQRISLPIVLPHYLKGRVFRLKLVTSAPTNVNFLGTPEKIPPPTKVAGSAALVCTLKNDEHLHHTMIRCSLLALWCSTSLCTSVGGTVLFQLALGNRLLAAKYERSPEPTPQMLIPTPERLLDVVEADVMFWAGLRLLTMADRLTRFAFSHQLTNKTAAEVCTGLLSFFGTVELPGTMVVDKGREFYNARVKSLLRELGVKAHSTTPRTPVVARHRRATAQYDGRAPASFKNIPN